jgi:hypothetical protein
MDQLTLAVAASDADSIAYLYASKLEGNLQATPAAGPIELVPLDC